MFDPRGDVKLCVGETDPATFTACSGALARASPVFERMLFGQFMESKPTTSGDWLVELPEDEPEALSIFLQISHGQFDQVPRAPLIDDLYDLTALSSYYDGTHMLEPWVGRWMSLVEDDTKASKESMSKSLWLAWEFGRKDPFCRLARRMLMESDGSEDPHLKMQPDIIGKFLTNITSKITNSVSERISPNHFTTIQALLDMIRKLINDLLVVDGKPHWCRHTEWMGPHRCESMILYSITFCLARGGLWPLLRAEDVMDSIVGLRRMTQLVIHDIGKVDDLDRSHCNPMQFLLSEVERVFIDTRNPVTKDDLEAMDKQ